MGHPAKNCRASKPARPARPGFQYLGRRNPGRHSGGLGGTLPATAVQPRPHARQQRVSDDQQAEGPFGRDQQVNPVGRIQHPLLDTDQQGHTAVGVRIPMGNRPSAKHLESHVGQWVGEQVEITIPFCRSHTVGRKQVAPEQCQPQPQRDHRHQPVATRLHSCILPRADPSTINSSVVRILRTASRTTRPPPGWSPCPRAR